MQVVAEPEDPTTLIPDLAVTRSGGSSIDVRSSQLSSERSTEILHFIFFSVREVGVFQEVSPLNFYIHSFPSSSQPQFCTS
jgi:hypothetical protein